MLMSQRRVSAQCVREVLAHGCTTAGGHRPRPSLRIWRTTISYLAAASLLGAGLNGCALFEPQIHNPALFDTTYGQASSANNPNQAKLVFAGDLADAIDDAAAQRMDYLDAVGTASAVRDIAPVVATALGASALFLGITTGGVTNVVAGLGGGSAATISLASFYDNRPRQLVYLSGADAIGCTIIAQRPLLMLKADYDDLVKNLNSLNAALDKLQVVMAQQTGVWPSDKYSPDGTLKIINDAVGVQRAGTAYRRGIDTAGFALREKVISIVNAVDREMVRTDPDPRTVTQLISGLGGATSGLLPGSTFQLPPPKAEAHAIKPDRTLEAAVEDVLFAEMRVKPYLDNAKDLDAVVSGIAACKPAEAQSTLRISPSDSAMTVAPGSTQNFTVRGASGVPTVGLSGDFPPGSITTNMTVPNGTIQIAVTFNAESAGKTAEMTIADASGLGEHKTSFQVSQAAAKGNGASTPQPNPAPDPAVQKTSKTAFEAGLTGRQILLMRTAVGAKSAPAALVNEITNQDREKIQAFKKANNLKDDSEIDSGTMDKMIAAARKIAQGLPNTTTLGDGEISSDDIKQIRTLCGLDPNAVPALDGALRGKVFDLQVAAQSKMPDAKTPPEMNGFLSSETKYLLLEKQTCAL